MIQWINFDAGVSCLVISKAGCSSLFNSRALELNNIAKESGSPPLNRSIYSHHEKEPKHNECFAFVRELDERFASTWMEKIVPDRASDFKFSRAKLTRRIPIGSSLAQMIEVCEKDKEILLDDHLFPPEFLIQHSEQKFKVRINRLHYTQLNQFFKKNGIKHSHVNSTFSNWRKSLTPELSRRIAALYENNWDWLAIQARHVAENGPL